MTASSSICVKVVVELQILKSGRARDVHASTVSPSQPVLTQAAADCGSGNTAWQTCQPPSKWNWRWPSLCRLDLERTGSVGEPLTYAHRSGPCKNSVSLYVSRELTRLTQTSCGIATHTHNRAGDAGELWLTWHMSQRHELMAEFRQISRCNCILKGIHPIQVIFAN